MARAADTSLGTFGSKRLLDCVGAAADRVDFVIDFTIADFVSLRCFVALTLDWKVSEIFDWESD